MRLISTVIQYSAKQLGFNDNDLYTLGVTSANVVYSTISKFDQAISKMIEFCMDTNAKLYI